MNRLLPLLCLASLSLPAAASGFYFQDVVFDHGSTLSGVIDLNTVSGTVVGANLSVITAGQSFALTRVDSSGPNVFSVSGIGAVLWIDLPVTTLVGYEGSTICGEVTDGCRYHSFISSMRNPDDYMVSGTMAPAPEPSSLWLLGTGLLGSVFITRFRSK